MECNKKTIILESTPQYDRIRTQCDDQNYVREYYMSQMSWGKAVAAVAYQLDVLMDMNILMINMLESQMTLTPEQQNTLNKIKYYHNQLTTLSLQSDVWEMDWVYGEVKLQQTQLGYQFFLKRAELEIGDPLPLPE